MATIKTGVCPVCLKDRQLAKFEFGIVRVTLCPHCLKIYLDSAIIPRIVVNNDFSQDSESAVVVGISYDE